MKKKLSFAILALCLVAVFAYATYQMNLAGNAKETIRIPVQKVSSDVKLSPADVTTLTAYREKREATRQEDMRTLQGLLDSGAGNATFLADAAAQLKSIVTAREAELAIEGALLGNGFSPCLAVVAPGSVTAMVSRDSLTRGEAALIMTLCESYTGESLENIRIMTGNMIE